MTTFDADQQQFPLPPLPPNTVIGRGNIGPGPAEAIPFSQLFSSATVAPEDFGAIGDGNADDTAAVQAAINSVGLGYCGVVLLRGCYKITSTLLIKYKSIRLEGIGWGIYTYAEPLALTVRKSMIVWAGNANVPPASRRGRSRTGPSRPRSGRPERCGR